MTLIDLQGRFSLLFPSLIESPRDITKDDIAGDLE